MSNDRESLQRVLLAEDKCMGEAHNVLSYLWRQLLQTAMPPSEAIVRWDNLMRRYVQRIKSDPYLPPEIIPENISSAKGNLRKELISPKMTWLNFAKGLYFLNVYQVILRVDCYWRDGSCSHHTITVYERNDPNGSLNRTHLKDILRDLWMDIFTYAMGEDRHGEPKDYLRTWQLLVNQYLNDPRNAIGNSPKKKTGVRGNLAKELLHNLYRDSPGGTWIEDDSKFLTWLSFEKGINLFNPQKTQFTLTCHWSAQVATHHSVSLKGSRQGVDATTALIDNQK